MIGWWVTHVERAGHLRLAVRFADGTEGRARFEPTALRGVFEPLREPAFFDRVFIDHGAVAWPGEIDLAPDTMHDDIAKTGEFVIR